MQTRCEGSRAPIETLGLGSQNVCDTKYTTSSNDFSNSAPVGYDGIGARRYVGLVLRTSF